jgi:hypothetical protein
VSTLDNVASNVADSVADTVGAGVTVDKDGAYPEERVWASVGAYYEASWLACFSFLAVYLATSDIKSV